MFSLGSIKMCCMLQKQKNSAHFIFFLINVDSLLFVFSIPWLLPILEADDVAKSIVNAVRCNQNLLYLPKFIGTLFCGKGYVIPKITHFLIHKFHGYLLWISLLLILLVFPLDLPDVSCKLIKHNAKSLSDWYISICIWVKAPSWSLISAFFWRLYSEEYQTKKAFKYVQRNFKKKILLE